MRRSYRDGLHADDPGAGPGALTRTTGDDGAWMARTPTRRLVAVEDDQDVIDRAIRRHEQRGWRYVEPDGAGPVQLYFGMRMLCFRRLLRAPGA